MRSAAGRFEVLFVVALSALAAAGCSRTDAAAPAAGGRGAGAAPPVPVTTAQVIRKSVPLDFQTIGTVEPFSTVSVHAQITGQLTSVAFKEGDDVQQGQVLFTLDKRPLEAALQQSQANLQRDQAQLVNARAQTERYNDLARRGIALDGRRVRRVDDRPAALDGRRCRCSTCGRRRASSSRWTPLPAPSGPRGPFPSTIPDSCRRSRFLST